MCRGVRGYGGMGWRGVMARFTCSLLARTRSSRLSHAYRRAGVHRIDYKYYDIRSILLMRGLFYTWLICGLFMAILWLLVDIFWFEYMRHIVRLCWLP